MFSRNRTAGGPTRKSHSVRTTRPPAATKMIDMLTPVVIEVAAPLTRVEHDPFVDDIVAARAPHGPRQAGSGFLAPGASTERSWLTMFAPATHSPLSQA